MGNNTSLVGRHKAEFVTDYSTEWQAIVDLLARKEYERAASLLQRTLTHYGSNNDPVAMAVLLAAHQICLSCKQIHAEINWYQRAHEDAAAREDELRQQLEVILTQAMAHVKPAGERKRLQEQQVEEGNGRTLWQRVRTIFHHGTDRSPPPEEEQKKTAMIPTKTVPVQSKMQDLKPGPHLTVYCLGAFRAYLNETLIDNWSGNKSKSIFKYMVTHRERPVPVEVLMELFWRDDDPESARRNLYQAIYLLRQVLQAGCPDFPHILSSNGYYELNPTLNIWLDSEAFLQHTQNGLRLYQTERLDDAIVELEAAESLYEDDFLIEDIYEDWPVTEREMLRNGRHDVLSRLAQYYYDRHNWPMCVTFNHKLVQVDNCNEDAHRHLMRAYLNQGQRHLALRQYHRCAEALQEELDVSPMPETVELYQRIQKV